MIRHSKLTIHPPGSGFHLITQEINRELDKNRPRHGLVNLFLRHTSAGLMINENADPDVLVDLESFFEKLVPHDSRLYRHTAEGPDDMPAHIKSSILGCSLTLPIFEAQLALGTWQGIYLCEFRSDPPPRTLLLTIYE